MPPQEQADLWMALRDRMKVNWAELTLQEKKAGTPPNSPQPGSASKYYRQPSIPPPSQLFPTRIQGVGEEKRTEAASASIS